MSQVTSAQNDQQDIKKKRQRLLLDRAQRKSIHLLSASPTVAKSMAGPSIVLAKEPPTAFVVRQSKATACWRPTPL